MKIVLKSAAFFLAAAFFIWVVLPVSADCRIYGGVARLHVIADGDGAEAQRVKLAVRDALLELARDRLADASSVDEARDRFIGMRRDMEELAESVLEREGAAYGARVILGEETYPTRTYGDLRLPAGEYFSVRVILGSGQGKNWWCLIFPPLCLGSAQPAGELESAGVGGESAKVFTAETPYYSLRFRILEFFSSLF